MWHAGKRDSNLLYLELRCAQTAIGGTSVTDATRGPSRHSPLKLNEVMEQFVELDLQRLNLCLYSSLDGSTMRNLGDAMWDDLNMKVVYDQIHPTSDASSDIWDVEMLDAGLATDAESAGVPPADEAGVIDIASLEMTDRMQQERGSQQNNKTARSCNDSTRMQMPVPFTASATGSQQRIFSVTFVAGTV
jgi:hypothetical protein